MVKIRWLGVAGIELTVDDQTILIDPYISRISKFDIFFGRPVSKTKAVHGYFAMLPAKPSGMIVGHTHFDHALDMPEFAKLSDCAILGSRSLDALMSIYGQKGRVTVCRGGETIRLSQAIRVTLIPSAHGRVAFGRVPYPGEIDPDLAPPLKTVQYRLGAVFAPKVEAGNMTFLHVGSANYMESEIAGHGCDILFMSVPGWKKIPGYTTRLLEMVHPKIIIPIHFDDFSVPVPGNGNPPSLPFQDMDGFLKNVSRSAPDAKIIIPTVFQDMIF